MKLSKTYGQELREIQEQIDRLPWWLWRRKILLNRQLQQSRQRMEAYGVAFFGLEYPK